MSTGTIHLSDECYNYIINNLEKNKTILELGSGYGSTVRLSKHFNMISVENQPEWQDKYEGVTTYINVGNRMYGIEPQWWNENDKKFEAYEGFDKYDKGWYNPDELIPRLPEKNDYHLILIDGPGGWLGRSGFLKYLNHFNTDIPIILDDAHRPQELLMLKILSKKLNKSYIILQDNTTGVIK